MAIIGAVAALGALGTLWGSSKASRAQRRQWEQYMALLRPILARQSAWADELRGRLGRPSRRLRAEHEESIGELGRTEQAALRRARPGMPGGGPGEQWRIRMSAEEQRNIENLLYGGKQEEFLGQARAEYGAALTNLGRSPALGFMGQATGAKAQATADFWGDFGGVLGGLAGGVESESMLAQLARGGEDDFEFAGTGKSKRRRRRTSPAFWGGSPIYQTAAMQPSGGRYIAPVQ